MVEKMKNRLSNKKKARKILQSYYVFHNRFEKMFEPIVCFSIIQPFFQLFTIFFFFFMKKIAKKLKERLNVLSLLCQVKKAPSMYSAFPPITFFTLVARSPEEHYNKVLLYYLPIDVDCKIGSIIILILKEYQAEFLIQQIFQQPPWCRLVYFSSASLNLVVTASKIQAFFSHHIPVLVH